MKQKRFVSSTWPIIFISFLGFVGSGLFIVIFTFWSAFTYGNLNGNVLPFIFCVFIGLLSIGFFCWSLDNVLSWLIIKNNQIIWKSPFRKSVKMNLDDCLYVGIEDGREKGRRNYFFNAMVDELNDRGDAFKFIYLSTHPYPEKYRGKIGTLSCKKGFVKFPYNDKVCLAIIESLHPNKVGRLQSFYNCMQWNDKLIAKKKEEKLKKKIRKKQGK